MKGFLYKIVFGGKVYVGSTTHIKRREYKHNADLKRGVNSKIYKEARELGLERLILEQIEEYDFETKTELRKREEELRRQLQADLNTFKAYCSPEERKAALKAYNQSEKRKEYNKAYEQSEERKAAKKAYNQTEERKAYHKAYNQTEERKAARKAYNQTEERKAARKAYEQSEERKAYHKAYKKAYREANRDEINRKRREKYALKKQFNLTSD